MIFFNHPLFLALFNTSAPRIILQANAPHFTIITYNEAYEKATNTTGRNVKGLGLWEAYPNNDQQSGGDILLNGLMEALNSNKIIKLPPFQYSIPSVDQLTTELNWWQLEIEPISTQNKPDYLLTTTYNITEKVLAAKTLDNFVKRESLLSQELAKSYEELASSNEELQASMEELMASNEALYESRQELKTVNDLLEGRIYERTQALDDNRKRLHNMIMTTPVAMTILKGPELIIELANEPMLHIWQRIQAQVIGNRLIDVFPELVDQPFPKLLTDVFKTRKRIAIPKIAVDISQLDGDNKRIYVNFCYDPIFDSNGQVECILATVIDITSEIENLERLEQSKAELQATIEELAATNEELATTNEELQEAQENLMLRNEVLSETEESLRLAVEAGNLGTYSVTLGTGKFQMSGRAREFWGFSQTAEINWGDVIANVEPEYLPLIEKARINALEHHLPFDVRYPITQLSTGARKWIRVSGRSLAATPEKSARFLGVIMDITAEVEYRKSLEESEERFRTMAENTDVMIAVGDESSNAIYFNKAWTVLTGRSMESLLEFGWADLIHPEDRDRYVDIYLTAFKAQAAFTGEFRILDHTGDYRWLLAKAPPRFHTDGSFAGYISSCVDITELKKDEQRKNDFIGMVSHELKTPLTAINGFVQVLQMKAEHTKDSFASTALNKAYNQIKKMTNMINGFLDVTRLESGKILIFKNLFQLDELLKEMIEEIDVIQSTHHISLQVEESITINADRDKISSVINNLLSNAVKYSPAGKNIEISCKTLNGFAQVSIKDQGIGIDHQEIEKLFGRYYRAVDNHTFSGFGIGLYLSAEIINQHHGKIWAESEIGKGSTFYFSLPL